jgi:Fe-S cluster assembly scaffold protein SufB
MLNGNIKTARLILDTLSAMGAKPTVDIDENNDIIITVNASTVGASEEERNNE